jgi:hypothetical protein
LFANSSVPFFLLSPGSGVSGRALARRIPGEIGLCAGLAGASRRRCLRRRRRLRFAGDYGVGRSPSSRTRFRFSVLWVGGWCLSNRSRSEPC